MASLGAAWTSSALAQSVCTSDGQPAPAALFERFMAADCPSCWSKPETPKPLPSQLVIDWIVPMAQGDDAALSAAASRDALARLLALGQPAPTTFTHTLSPTTAKPRPSLRVAHGLPFGGYVGASIAMQAVGKPSTADGPWTAWLLLVETIPAGTEGTPVERHLARNLLTVPWPASKATGARKAPGFTESRVMGIPEGAQPDRLRVIGWVQDAAGRVVSIAQSRCNSPR